MTSISHENLHKGLVREGLAIEAAECCIDREEAEHFKNFVE